MLGSQVEFAKHIKATKPYVTKLKNQGRLVFEKDKIDGKTKVNFEKSLKLMAATADPANDASGVMPMATPGVAEQYQTSRAMKESYIAELKKLEYEATAGGLLDREGVTIASFKIARILRDKLAAIPARLAPLLTVETEQKEVYAILTQEIEGIITQIQMALADERRGKL